MTEIKKVCKECGCIENVNIGTYNNISVDVCKYCTSGLIKENEDYIMMECNESNLVIKENRKNLTFHSDFVNDDFKEMENKIIDAYKNDKKLVDGFIDFAKRVHIDENEDGTIKGLNIEVVGEEEKVKIASAGVGDFTKDLYGRRIRWDNPSQ